MKSISNAFRALADPTRRQILQELKRGELSAGAIAACFTISGPSISRHLSILKNADLISERRGGYSILFLLEEEEKAQILGDIFILDFPTQISQRIRNQHNGGICGYQSPG